MNRIFIYRAKEYLKYLWRATPVDRLHSPFVFEFYNEVVKKKHTDPRIEKIREQLLQDDTVIEVEDMGAGAVDGTHKKRKISDIAKSDVKPKQYSGVLYNLVNFYQPHRVVELGTSLGITTLYMQSATVRPIYTLEGSENVAAVAQKNFTEFGGTQPSVVVGNFDDTLSTVLPQDGESFMIYIDGNHTYEATVRYFKMILPLMREGDFIVFDDIYWSPDMARAWNEIKNHPKVNLSIDLYQLGVIFSNPDFIEKQDFTLSLRRKVV